MKCLRLMAIEFKFGPTLQKIEILNQKLKKNKRKREREGSDEVFADCRTTYPPKQWTKQIALKSYIIK